MNRNHAPVHGWGGTILSSGIHQVFSRFDVPGNSGEFPYDQILILKRGLVKLAPSQDGGPTPPDM